MVFLDKYGWPVERIRGHRLVNFLRLLLHTRRIRRGRWDGCRIVRTALAEGGAAGPPSDTVRHLPSRPKVVTLCGSTRFMDAFFEQGWRLTLEGVIVLSVGVCKHAEHHGGEALGGDVCERLDELHWRKIDLSDEILVLNVGGYIGESTRAEIEYATRTGKPVRYLEEVAEEGSGG